MKERVFKYVIWFLTLCVAFLFGVWLTAYNLCKLIPEAAEVETTVQCDVVIEEEPTVEQEVEQEDQKEEIHIDEIEQTTEVEPVVEYISLGEFKLTAYCDCMYCCGKTDGITATGTKATEGRTIAVDPSIIPYGSVVVINGNEYIAEDCGGAIDGNRIDVFFYEHSDALKFGVQFVEIYVKG